MGSRPTLSLIFDLEIDSESSSSISSNEETPKSSDEGTICSSGPKKGDCFQKRTYQTTTMQDFFVKKPKPSPSSLQSTIVINEEESSPSLASATKK